MARGTTDFLTTEDAACLIGKSADWLQRTRKPARKGEGPPWYRVGGRVFYARADVLEWLEQRFCQ